MKSIQILSASLMVLALTACGGGGSEKAPSPPPVSQPSPSPTPTPAPATYSTFAQLTGNRSFDSACTIFFNGSQPWLSSGFGAFPDVGSSLNIDYLADSDSWTVEGASDAPFSYTFSPSDRSPTSSSSEPVYRKADGKGFDTRFAIGARALGSQAPEYVRTARMIARPDAALSDYFCVFGVPTRLDDTLPTSTLRYSAFSVLGTLLVTGGALAGQYELSESVVTLSANPSTGEILTTIDLVGRQFMGGSLSETRTDLGSYYGEASIDGSVASFSGGIFGSDRAVGAANFSGWFFGPQGREAGYSFAIDSFGAEGESWVAVGSVTARR
ncbi:hypothetical protein [Sphingomicrobium arenosum]|uniref:hypothetical protein n=1 Tax=Sphingomicrobium arenosum TaxID=2233861 RepID=UPI00224027C6|nr:hypothetical protein [Sphingomicrobium arenosum]